MGQDRLGPGLRPQPPRAVVTGAGRGVGSGPAPAAAGFGAGQRAGVVPRLAADLVEGPRWPGHHVERVRAAHRVHAPLGDHFGGPVRRIGRHVGDRRAALRADQVEEPLQGGLVPTWSGPDQPPTVVINHDAKLPVPLLVADLIDPDAPCRAHGTATTTPCWGQRTRGASASSTACTVPRSSACHRRRPSPRWYQRDLRSHRPPRCRAPLRGRTRATTSPASSSSSTPR